MRWAILVVLSVSLMSAMPAVDAQAASSAPAMVVGNNVAYCHVTEDDLTVWMNTLLDDGAGVPYYLTGPSAFTDPAAGIGMDPVVNEDFEARIPLTPVNAEGFTIEGTVKAHAYIGSGAYGGGVADIGASLVVDGTEIGAEAPKEHQMSPKNGNVPGGTGPYDLIEWSFDVPATQVPAGAKVEWVVSGHIVVVNNMFMACHEARGRSNIEIPVTARGGSGSDGGGSSGNSTSNSTGSSTVSVTSSASNTTTSGSSSTSRSTTPTTTASGSRSTTTGNATVSDEKGAPALAMPIAAFGLVAVALVARRRLR